MQDVQKRCWQASWVMDRDNGLWQMVHVVIWVMATYHFGCVKVHAWLINQNLHNGTNKPRRSTLGDCLRILDNQHRLSVEMEFLRLFRPWF